VPLTFERIKSLGAAGTLSYVLAEVAFWALAVPAAVLFYRTADGTWLALSDVDDRAKLLGAGAVFINVVRAFVPLRLAAALALVPTVERLFAKADVAALKAALQEAAGSRNGTDRTAAQAAVAATAVEALCAANQTWQPAKVDLRKSVWKLVYTDSTGNSSGKLGPLVGRVTQEFSADGKSYANVVSVGPLVVRLDASYAPKSATRLAVQFEAISVSLGGLLLLRKPFEAPKPRGSWDMRFSDADTRVLIVPETGNVFCLTRTT
jgi:hypothetical protein